MRIWQVVVSIGWVPFLGAWCGSVAGSCHCGVPLLVAIWCHSCGWGSIAGCHGCMVGCHCWRVVIAGCHVGLPCVDAMVGGIGWGDIAEPILRCRC